MSASAAHGGHNNILEMPHSRSHRPLLLTYSFQLWFSFPPKNRNCFSQFDFFTFAQKGTMFIPWPWTLTYDLDLWSYELDIVNVKMNHRAKHLSQWIFSSNVIARAHTQQSDCITWTTRWPVVIHNGIFVLHTSTCAGEVSQRQETIGTEMI